MHKLTLLIPGFAGPDSRYPDDYLPQLPALETLLARSTRLRTDAGSRHTLIGRELGQVFEAGADIPVAAVTRLRDEDVDDSGIWLRADPVHLSPDRDGLVLMDAFILNLDRHDALAIAAEVNRLLADRGWVIEVPSEDRWYIRLAEPLAVTCPELPEMVGRDIARHLPAGPDAIDLHGLLNEIQMHLYDTDINRLRERNGRLPVNSVWFWGQGRLPAVEPVAWSTVYSEDAYAQGLCRLQQISSRALPESFGHLQADSAAGDEVLVILPQCEAPAQYRNLQLWHLALGLLEERWFAPLLAALRAGRIGQLRLVTHGQTFTAGRLALARLWRRNLPLGHYRLDD